MAALFDPDFPQPGAQPAGPLPYGEPPHDLPEGEGELEKRPSRWFRWTVRIISAGFLLFFLLIGWLAFTAPLSKSLEPIAPPQITLLASDGTPIARNGAIVEKPVHIADLPKHVPAAFVAIEDRRFYDHLGIDPRGIARAVWTNATTGRTQGGSTITQQLAKFTFLSPRQSLGRKAREALIAFWLEFWLTKDEILERYLSNAYFGDNAYGLRAASLHYFNRQPERLTVEQAAMLAGLVKAPSRLAPTRNYNDAEARMRLVLAAMEKEGWLDAGDARRARAPRLDVRARNDLPTGTYFADWALPEARKLNDVGYARETITTTLDSRLQAAARHAVNNASLGDAQVALVAMRPNGEVVAMLGGRDYAASPFNRVTQARRQPGSTFKLFVYLTALKQGWKPDDRIDNSAIEAGSYRPKNASGNYSDQITLEDAFARSSNVAAVRLLAKVGDEAVIKTARDFGVTAALPKGDPSLALGTSAMTLMELTAAYAGVAANAYPVMPHAFPEEEKGWFASFFGGPKHLPSRVHEDMERMLRTVVNRGSGRAAMLSGPNFGKTGTSQDNRDALFIGYADDLVVGVWVGNDDNSPLKGIHGGSVPARIWRDFMVRALGPQAAPRTRPDPEGPVEPLDVPDVEDIPVTDIPLGNDANLHIENGQAILTTMVDGKPVKLGIDPSRLTATGQQIAERVAQAVEQRAREAERAEARRQAQRDALEHSIDEMH